VFQFRCAKVKRKSNWTCSRYFVKPTIAVPTAVVRSIMGKNRSHPWQLTTRTGCSNGYVRTNSGLKGQPAGAPALPGPGLLLAPIFIRFTESLTAPDLREACDDAWHRTKGQSL